MSNSNALVTTNQSKIDDDYVDAFLDVNPIDPFELKKNYLATQLAALMSYNGKTRSEMAAELGWQKSRVTKVLSGNDNLTIKSICEFSTHLGYDFDILFHFHEQPRPKQPWQIRDNGRLNIFTDALHTFSIPLQLQSPSEVLSDILSGNGESSYWSFDTHNMFGSIETIDLTRDALLESKKTDSISNEIEILATLTN